MTRASDPAPMPRLVDDDFPRLFQDELPVGFQTQEGGRFVSPLLGEMARPAATHIFRDEWLVRLVTGLPDVDEPFVAGLRARGESSIADSLIKEGRVTRRALADLVRERTGVETESLDPQRIEPMAAALVGERVCRKHGIVPLRVRDELVEVAMADPLNLDALSDVQALTGRAATARFALAREVAQLLDRIFDADVQVFDLLDRLAVDDDVEVLGEGGGTEVVAEVKAPVVRLVNSVIAKAVHQRASDIHLEHSEDLSLVRYRIDGELHPALKLPRPIAVGPMVARLKIMSNLDIANRMRPQDGRAKLRMGASEIGLRVSTLPTAFGEKVVIRILDKAVAQMPLSKLGLRPEVGSRLERIASEPQGILLVTGPTGSGKTTTLYSILNRRRDAATNIVSIEDPIEYRLEGVNQVQVNEKQGLGFATVLRSVLRQDPDVIMVGEIRDKETADIAVQAAMTGHLVLSTLHTNDAVSTLARLVDMGVERFKLAPALLGVTAQRLVKRLCPACREPLPDAKIPAPIKRALIAHGLDPRAWTAPGCAKCEGRGYQGRASVVEMLALDDALRGTIEAGAPAEEIKAVALKMGLLRTMTADALSHVSAGTTNLEEVVPYLQLEGERPAAAPAPAPAATPGEARPRVLIVDDDPALRLVAAHSLGPKDFEIREAADGIQALKAIDEWPPDAVLLDLKMPALDGFAVIRELRRGRGLTSLPILVLTTEKDDASQELALTLGADDYAIKPVKPRLLLARVKAALRRSGRLSWTERP